MKATIITSAEYDAIHPSIFAIIDRKYYGCLHYPKKRLFPEPYYWLTARSSEHGSYFRTVVAEIDEEQFNQIAKLQACIDATSGLFVYVAQTKYPFKAPPTLKKGNAYKEYQEYLRLQREAHLEDYEHNTPYRIAHDTAFQDLHIILKQLRDNNG